MKVFTGMRLVIIGITLSGCIPTEVYVESPKVEGTMGGSCLTEKAGEECIETPEVVVTTVEPKKIECSIIENVASCAEMTFKLDDSKLWKTCDLIVSDEKEEAEHQLNCAFDKKSDPKEDPKEDPKDDPTDEDDDVVVASTPMCVKDGIKSGKGQHTLFLNGIGRFIATEDVRYTEFSDGTANLFGTLRGQQDPTIELVVDATFSGRTDMAPEGSPKLELPRKYYVNKGGPVDPKDWVYYTSTEAFVISVGTGLSGFQITDIERDGPAYQVGFGASGKNKNFGASGWLKYSEFELPDGFPEPSNKRGDFNFDIVPCDL